MKNTKKMRLRRPSLVCRGMNRIEMSKKLTADKQKQKRKKEKQKRLKTRHIGLNALPKTTDFKKKNECVNGQLTFLLLIAFTDWKGCTLRL